MKIKISVLLIIMVILLIGCSSDKSENTSENESNNEIPSDISKENYDKLVKEYETYEQRVEESNGQFFGEKEEQVTDLVELAGENVKLIESGKEPILTDVEDELIDNIIKLYALRQDEETAFMFTHNTNYDDPVEYTINLEENIISTLELDRSSITAELMDGSALANNDDKNNDENMLGIGDTSKPNGEVNLEYEPEFLSQQEWEECVQGDAYTLGECIDYDQYYANGDGQHELAEAEEDNFDESYVEDVIPDQETADEVQQYIVNVVNDLTIIDNMVSDIGQLNIYNDKDIHGVSELTPEAEAQLQESIEVMKMGLDDLESLNAPKNTEYYVLEPQLKEIVNGYQSIIETVGDTSTNESIPSFQALDEEMKAIESSIAISIMENNYLEYDVLLDVWNRGENYQFDKDSFAIISSGLRQEFALHGIDFEYDLIHY